MITIEGKDNSPANTSLLPNKSGLDPPTPAFEEGGGTQV